MTTEAAFNSRVFESLEFYEAASLDQVASALLEAAFRDKLEQDYPSIEAAAFAMKVAETIPGAKPKIFGDSSGQVRADRVTEEGFQQLELNGLVMRRYLYTDLHLSLTRKGHAALSEVA